MTEHYPSYDFPDWGTAERDSASADVSATPFAWIDPKNIPPREWVYGRHYIRSFVSATVAASGVGKSSLSFVEALAMITGRALLGIEPNEIVNVWLWNEDPLIEMQRRVSGAALRYNLGKVDLEGSLFFDSARNKKIIVCQQTPGGAKIVSPVVDGVVETMKEHEIGVFIVDPFVSTHEVSENDNGAIEKVVRGWCEVAERTGASVELVHHSRKSNGSPVTIEDARGASAWIAATRSARVINVMSETEAAKANIESESRRQYFRVENGKASMARAMNRSDWYFLESVELGNSTYKRPSDQVGVATAWEWPTVEVAELDLDTIQTIQVRIMAGKNRASPQADDWAGLAVAEALKLNATIDKAVISAHLGRLVEGGWLVPEKQKSPKGRLLPLYKIGSWARHA